MNRVSDLNVTPMIDVLLVLLVIFMAALPLGQRGLDITLPPPQNDTRAVEPGAIVLEYTADRQVSINQQRVALVEVEARLRAIYNERRDKTLFIMGDAALRYGEIVGVIDAARGAGVSRVGVITDGMRRR